MHLCINTKENKMEQVTIGNTGLKVSQLCFGTMTFAEQVDKQMAYKLYSQCREHNINFFDCADVYNNGDSERFLGELVAQERDNIILTSKVGFRMWEGGDGAGLNKAHITLACEASLKRLNSDYLDIYFVHCFDKNCSIEETLETLNNLKQAGKIRFIGVSNWAAWQIAKAHGISAFNNWAKFEVIQLMYSLLKRQAEVELFPMAQDAAMGIVSYNPLGGGLLTGKYKNDLHSGAGRLSSNIGYLKRYGEPWMLDCVEQFCKMAQELNCAPATLAIAWVMQQPALTCPIIGARNSEQLAQLLAATDLKLDVAVYERIAALSPKLPSPTDH
jgi:aryl-alcohol dehydrogenase-like predicted oxidoreductase